MKFIKIFNLKDIYSKILHTRGTPYSVALGVSIGVFWNFIPSLGFGVILSLITSKFLRAKAIIAATVNLATSFFIPLFYSLNIITGKILMSLKVNVQEIEGKLNNSIEKSTHNIETIMDKPTNFFLMHKIQSLSIDFLIGSVVNALLIATLIYFFLRFILTNKKEKQQKLLPSKNKE